MDATVKAGIAFEQSKAKQESMTDRRKLEDGVRALSMKTKKKKKAAKVDCDTCTFPTHSEGACPAKELECFECGKTGHFSGSKACKLKKDSKNVDKKKRKGEKKKGSKSRKVEESEGELDTDSESSYRVKEVSPE